MKYAQLRAQIMATLVAPPEIDRELIWREIEAGIDRLITQGAEVVNEPGYSFVKLGGMVGK